MPGIEQATGLGLCINLKVNFIYSKADRISCFLVLCGDMFLIWLSMCNFSFSDIKTFLNNEKKDTCSLSLLHLIHGKHIWEISDLPLYSRHKGLYVFCKIFIYFFSTLKKNTKTWDTCKLPLLYLIHGELFERFLIYFLIPGTRVFISQ